MTFSAGVATLKDDDKEATMLKWADQALYKAKHSGRNLVLSGEDGSAKQTSEVGKRAA